MQTKLFLLLLISCSLVSCGKQELSVNEEGDTKIRLALNWFPDSQHGGFYAAQLHGFYKAQGLDVEIISGGPGVPLREKVTRRQVEFAVSNADVILTGRKQGAPIKALIAPLQNSPRCIMVHEESGITKLSELENVTLALGQGKAFAEFLKANLTLKDVRIVSFSGDVALFVSDKSYTQQGYVFSEPFVAKRKGANPRSLMVSDLGFNPYTSCVFTHEKLIEENPELVRKFVKATRLGWQKYIEFPDETNAHIVQLNHRMDAESLKYGAEAMKPLCLPESLNAESLNAESLNAESLKDAEAIGQMTPQRWETLAVQLQELGLLPAEFDSTQAYTTEFLKP